MTFKPEGIPGPIEGEPVARPKALVVRQATPLLIPAPPIRSMSTFRAKQLIRDNLSIPTLPAVVQKISNMIQDPDSGAAEIGMLVADDAPLAAKVLRIANSAYYGLRERCLSTEQATSVLGVKVLNNVVRQAAVIQQFAHLKDCPGFDIDDIWRHSILVAHASAEIARRSTCKLDLTPEEFHVCGLLHDLGKVIMLDSMGTEYLTVYQEAPAIGEPLHILEEKRFGFNHTDVGAMVSVRWALPAQVSAAIQYHHGPRESVQEDPVVALIANANLVSKRVSEDQHEAAALTFDEATMSFLGIDSEAVEGIIEYVDQAKAELVL